MDRPPFDETGTPRADGRAGQTGLRADSVLGKGGASFGSRASIGVVAQTDQDGQARAVTRGLIERIARGVQGDRLRAQVAAWNQGATREEVAEAFQEACTRAVQACRGQSEGEVLAWLRTTTHRELGQLRRRASARADRELPVDEASFGFEAVTPPVQSPEEELLDRERLAELKRATGAVLTGLSERQRQIVVLHCRGRRRPEIARHLGMTQRSVKRALERIMSHGRAELVHLAGHGCASGEALVSRLAFGLAGEREIRAAQLHLATCPRCATLYEQLDLWREKVAALLPLPVVAHAQPGLVERAIDAAADRLAWTGHHGGENSAPVREHVLELGGRLKQHATATYVRVADPTPLAGVRPGAVAAAVAGCLALGTGATYCLQRGVDPIGGLSGVLASADPQATPTSTARQRPRRARPAAATATVPAATPTPTATRTPIATPTPQATAALRTPTPSPPPAPQDEYEPTSATSAASSPRQSSAGQREPAPAPANGPGEFDGP